jgi:hypothetical protein
MAGEIISEWRARSSRNGGRHHSGISSLVCVAKIPLEIDEIDSALPDKIQQSPLPRMINTVTDCLIRDSLQTRELSRAE